MEGNLTSERNVESLRLLAQLLKLLDGLLVELNLLKVLTDSRGGHTLGNDGVVVESRPGENDLRGGHSLALSLGETVGDGLDLGGVDEQRDAPGVVAKGGVGGQDDTLLLEVGNELGVGDAGVTLDLVNGGGDTGLLDDGLELRKGQ